MEFIEIDQPCMKCGENLQLRVGDHFPENQLDLTLECSDGCGAPVLNAFVPLTDFIPVE